jgi:hypothetical protein
MLAIVGGIVWWLATRDSVVDDLGGAAGGLIESGSSGLSGIIEASSSGLSGFVDSLAGVFDALTPW